MLNHKVKFVDQKQNSKDSFEVNRNDVETLEKLAYDEEILFLGDPLIAGTQDEIAIRADNFPRLKELYFKMIRSGGLATEPKLTFCYPPKSKEKTVSDYAKGWLTATFTPTELVKHITSGQAYCVSNFAEGHRKGDNFLSSQIIAIDIDNGKKIKKVDTQLSNHTLDDIAGFEFFQQHGYIALPSPSWTAEWQKLRVIYILDKPVYDRKEYKKMVVTVMDAHKQFGEDTACKDEVRLFFGSVKGQPLEMRRHNGKTLKADTIKTMIAENEKATIKAKPKNNKEGGWKPTGTFNNDLDDVAKVLELLLPSRADEYQTWLEVGMALHTIGAFELWDNWSQQSSNYGDTAKKWASFSGSDIGIGSLKHWAKEDNPIGYAEYKNKKYSVFIEYTLPYYKLDGEMCSGSGEFELFGNENKSAYDMGEGLLNWCEANNVFSDRRKNDNGNNEWVFCFHLPKSDIEGFFDNGEAPTEIFELLEAEQTYRQQKEDKENERNRNNPDGGTWSFFWEQGLKYQVSGGVFDLAVNGYQFWGGRWYPYRQINIDPESFHYGTKTEADNDQKNFVEVNGRYYQVLDDLHGLNITNAFKIKVYRQPKKVQFGGLTVIKDGASYKTKEDAPPHYHYTPCFGDYSPTDDTNDYRAILDNLLSPYYANLLLDCLATMLFSNNAIIVGVGDNNTGDGEKLFQAIREIFGNGTTSGAMATEYHDFDRSNDLEKRTLYTTCFSKVVILNGTISSIKKNDFSTLVYSSSSTCKLGRYNKSLPETQIINPKNSVLFLNHSSELYDKTNSIKRKLYYFRLNDAVSVQNTVGVGEYVGLQKGEAKKELLTEDFRQWLVTQICKRSNYGSKLSPPNFEQSSTKIESIDNLIKQSINAGSPNLDGEHVTLDRIRKRLVENGHEECEGWKNSQMGNRIKKIFRDTASTKGQKELDGKKAIRYYKNLKFV